MSNLQLAKDMFANFARGDVESVLAGYDPALQWSLAEGNPYQMDGAAWNGPETVLEKLFAPIGRDWEGFAIHIERFHEAGDYVVMEGRVTGTYKPTGKRLDAQTCDILCFRDGKLIRFQQYYDTAQLQRVMG
jgi:uncharacterized protein